MLPLNEEINANATLVNESSEEDKDGMESSVNEILNTENPQFNPSAKGNEALTPETYL